MTFLGLVIFLSMLSNIKVSYIRREDIKLITPKTDRRNPFLVILIPSICTASAVRHKNCFTYI